MNNADLLQTIEDGMSSFSRGQKLIAAYILEHYDKAAYYTASKLGAIVGVSESTVVRFANELGYEGYAEFQQASQKLVRTKLTPNQRIELSKETMRGGDIIEKVMSSDISKIRHTLEQIDRQTFSNKN